MNHPQRSGESLEIDAGALGCLAFRWLDDRYQHEWLFGDSDQGPRIISQESSSKAAWPDSPPLQQIHRQTFADGREVIFGVGMAGRGHWSASFTLVPDLASWIVELACRAPARPDRLLSSYRLEGDWQSDAQGVVCHVSQPGSRIEAIQPSSLADFADTQLQIRPTQIGEEASTTQWAFRIRIG